MNHTPAGSRQQAKELAQQRWEVLFPFDLDGEFWDWAFDQYSAGEVLEAQKLCARYAKDPNPEVIVNNLRYWLDRVHSGKTNSLQFN